VEHRAIGGGVEVAVEVAVDIGVDVPVLVATEVVADEAARELEVTGGAEELVVVIDEAVGAWQTTRGWSTPAVVTATIWLGGTHWTQIAANGAPMPVVPSK
jgi:hypothetical protein